MFTDPQIKSADPPPPSLPPLLPSSDPLAASASLKGPRIRVRQLFNRISGTGRSAELILAVAMEECGARASKLKLSAMSIEARRFGGAHHRTSALCPSRSYHPLRFVPPFSNPRRSWCLLP
ncbi:unnamed protein product [Rhodiola kirilowii]